MKKVKIYLGVILLIIGNIAFAQPQGGGQRGGQQGPPTIPNQKQIEKMVKNLASEISLTSEQESSVLKLYMEYFDEVKIKTSGKSKPKPQEMEALKKRFEMKVKALLTYEQQIKFDAYLIKHKSRQAVKPRP